MPNQIHHQRAGQEGSRWVNVRPSGEEVAKWFTDNVPMHDGMEADDFLTGVTLIPAKAKEDEVVGFRDDGAPIIQERQNLVFVPYIKVETRIAYFWRLMEKHPEWLGVIEPVGQSSYERPGFSTRTEEGVDGKKTTFLECSMRVRVYKRETVKLRVQFEQTEAGETVKHEWVEGETIIDAPPATKAVNVLGRYGPDENARMKAETGAIGRALGFAGILVAPGSGVATAEDMEDHLAAERRPTVGSDAATLPGDPQTAVADDEASLRERAKVILAELGEHHPQVLAEFQEWARSRKFGSLNSLMNPALKGVVRKLERDLAGAQERAQQGAGEPEVADVALGGEEGAEEPQGGDAAGA